ncbi:hypothetical protein KXR64_20940 [Brucella intermedia]|uniref:RHS repeat-associated core domain-containing protein n=1 Tax=Brucella TaxID=234 RepID=UPI0009D7184E|nr:RHS repeat-associated core domain-containing protein [Brucella intermedia]
MSVSLFSKTPSVKVVDNRGLVVREITYHRHPDEPEVTNERITSHRYDVRGFLAESADPRMREAGHTNFTYLANLAGNIVRTSGADNGTTVSLNDAAGRPFILISNIAILEDGTEDRSQAVTKTWQYEDSEMPGRPVSVTEEVAGEVPRITERFVYAGCSDEEKAFNLAGQCVSHYDTAGVVRTDSVAVTGVPLSVTRCLRKDSNKPEAIAEWPGNDCSAWNKLLDDDQFTAISTADATGALLTFTDAKGNMRRVQYDVAGLLSASWLTIKGGEEQPVVKSLSYSAAGQAEREEHGNGVITSYTFEPETQRLTGIRTERPKGHGSGQKVLQDLRYEYDPAGNVVAFYDKAEEIRFSHNQKVTPGNSYIYDSLYQLVKATGRELTSSALNDGGLPAPIIPPVADSIYTNYTRHYDYDSAGNLTQFRHFSGKGSGFTRKLTISNRSNRALMQSLCEMPADVDAMFTTGGQQSKLRPGQALVWNSRNELSKATQVVRENGPDDSECYRYDAGGRRILKIGTQKTGTGMQTRRVVYLAGVELRTRNNGDREAERMQVITVSLAGRAQVRVLHWEKGKPDAIDNAQIRWSYGNLTGSSTLELDSEGNVISKEEYYPYGGTAIWTARSQTEADYKTIRYSGKERDVTGLYYYGYRYYQPWLGRWLSADPAGAVDGLNLYRMVRNNPVTLKDNDGLRPINENFREEKGDMVYGLARVRTAYVPTALGREFDSNDKNAPAIIIDLYNNTISGQSLLSADPAAISKFIISPKKKYEKKLAPPSNIKDLVKGARNYPLWDDFFKAGENNPKFNIANIYREVRKSPGISPYHVWNGNSSQLAPRLLWKRGSKIGIEMTASGAGNRIHFALDGLDEEKIVHKEGAQGQSITASELRYVYRNRERLAGKVFFYRNKAETDAPWITNPGLWASYSPRVKQGGMQEVSGASKTGFLHSIGRVLKRH